MAALLLSLPVAAAEWRMDPAQSMLRFVAERTQLGDNAPNFEMPGGFERWTAEIDFDPDQPDLARILVEIDMTSLTAVEASVAQDAATEPWLFTSEYATATYAADGFSPLGDGRFRTQGPLMLRGVGAPAILEFTINIDGDVARAEGGGVVLRLNHGVGANAGPSLALPEVRVEFVVVADRVK